MSLFQFQYGPIKSFKAKKDIELAQKFQFQYGPIKRQSREEIRTSKLCFNSNMVRLKDCIEDLQDDPQTVSIPIWSD